MTTNEVVIETVRAMARRGALPKNLADSPLSPETQIDDLGIDSLGKLNLVTEVEERAGVAVSEGMLVGLRTLGDLAALVDTLVQARKP